MAGKKRESKPRFIIKDGDIYYISIRVWEFDLEKARKMGEKFIDGCEEVARYFEHHPKISAVRIGRGALAGGGGGGGGGGGPNHTNAAIPSE